MKIKATLSIAYRQDCISIRIHDEASRIEFLDAEISHHEFSRGLSSLQGRPFIECEVRGLQWIGKKCVTEKRSIECPLTTYDREKLSEWLRANAQEEGWLVSAHLGSQGSIDSRDGKTILNYSVTKYVEVE